MHILNLAHRGASGEYPENTMLAFEKAIEQGADGFETDVHLSADGELVVIHDDTLDRTTNGTGNVYSYSFSELRRLSAGKSNGINGLKMPHLREVLELVRDKGMVLNIEIKNNTTFYPNIEEKVINLIYEYKLLNSVLLSSFNHQSMALCKKIAPRIKTGLLYSQPLYRTVDYAKMCGADALHPHYLLAIHDKALREDCNKESLGLNVWTVNETEDMLTMINMGVNSIITNFPGKLSKILNRKKV